MNENKYRKDRSSVIVFAVPLIFLLVFLFYPLACTMLRAFMPTGSNFDLHRFTFVGFKQFGASSLYKNAMKNSFIISFSVTFFTLLIGIPMGYCLARVNLPGRKLMRSLAVLPVIMPSFIGAFSWIILLGNKGILRQFFDAFLKLFGGKTPSIYGLPGIVFVMTMTYYPFVVMFCCDAFASANSLLEDSAMLMGATKWRVFRTITFPLIIPNLAASALLIFVRAIGNFGIPAIIGGNQYVLPTLIYFRINGFWDLNGASSLAVVNVVITGLVLLLQRHLVNKRNYEVISATHRDIQLVDKGWAKVLAMLYCVLVLAISLAPQVTIIIMSFAKSWTGMYPKGFTLGNYRMIPLHSGKEMFNSLYLALIATVLTSLLGSIVAYIVSRKKFKAVALLDFGIMFPFILPGTIVSVALLSAFSNNPIVPLGGTYTIIVISYMLRRTPYVYRSVSANLTQLSPSLEEASIISGASWWYTFRRVTIPLVWPSILSGSILTFATLIQELSTTILLYSSKTRTVPVQIYGAVADGTLGKASALSVVLLMVVFAVVYISNRMQGKEGTAGLAMS